MKDCRDCRWNKRAWEQSMDKCRHPATSTYSDISRSYGCGSKAQYFEPKPPPVAWRDRIAMAWRILRGEIQPETKQDPPAYVVGQWSE